LVLALVSRIQASALKGPGLGVGLGLLGPGLGLEGPGLDYNTLAILQVQFFMVF